MTKQEYSNLSDVRQAIDVVDREVVALLAKRWALAMTAVSFKINEPVFRDDARRTRLLEERTSWGEAAGFPPDATKKLFNKLIDIVEEEQTKMRDKLNL